MVKTYLKGSEWIKCDLHLHTPDTKLNGQGFELGDKNDVWERYCELIENSDVMVFGITDYYSCENYFKFIDLFKSKYPDSIKKFFPNIEFRLEVSVNKSGEEVNIHVIFSNEDDVTNEKLNDFLSKLETNITRNGSPITCEKLSSQDDFKKAAIKYSDIRKALKKVFGNDEPYLIFAASNNQGLRADNKSPRKLNITDEIDKVCDGFFGGVQNIKYYLNENRYEVREDGSRDLAKKCPVLSGCDAHSFEDLENKLGKEFEKRDPSGIICDSSQITWIKVEPTFEGLKYLTYEPDDRIFIGNMPEVEIRVVANKTRYISRLEVSKVEGYNESQGVWFQDQVIFPSKELTAIIGNKGKGKSALTDIIGLLGNSHNEEFFSFLSPKKFRKGGLARNFEATLTWESGYSDTKNLAEPTDTSTEEKVKYLPQSYFEDLCNEIDNNKNFITELNQVVFKHIDSTDRLGKNTFDEFINEKKRNSEITIEALRDKLSSVNTQMVSLQSKDTDEYKKSIESKIKNKKEELASHITNMPKDPFPDDSSEKGTEAEDQDENYKKLKEVESKLTASKKLRQEYLDSLELINGELTELNQLKYRFKSENERVDAFREAEKPILEVYGISIEDLYPKSKINLVPIEKVISKKENDKLRLQIHLGKVSFSEEDHTELLKEGETLLINLISSQELEYKTLSDSLDATQKAKEDYKNALTKWQTERREIEGDAENPSTGTLNFYLIDLKYIEEKLSMDIGAKKLERRSLAEKIYDEKKKIVDIYSSLKKNIDKVLEDNSDKIKEYKISLDASMQIRNLQDNFLDFIDKNRVGSFYGSEDAKKEMRAILDGVEPNNKESIIALLEGLTTKLESKEGEKQNPFNQIKNSKNLNDLYDYIFGLDYLQEKYELRFAGKSIEQLSPGERGAALIVFYLLLDNDDKPLIIDQPEDNLDNQSVYEILVPFIKQAKKHRQIIIVTHNPNLAVVADAELIIHVDIKKENNYQFSFLAGGIENPQINRGIVDILEGTMPAFDKRKLKYLKNKI